MTIALLGVGMMGENLLAGLLASGISPDEIIGTDLRPERQREITEKYWVKVVSDNSAAAVVPPGEVTFSRSTAGWVPESRRSLADPYRVWVARVVAMSRGSPSRTPASIMASAMYMT